METLFAMYSAVKMLPNADSFIKSTRCKIFDISTISSSAHWRIEKWWTEKELKDLKLLEDEIQLQTVLDSLENTKTNIELLIQEKENVSLSKGEVKLFKASDLFDIERGDMTITRRLIKAHKGDYPVYSGMTRNNGLIGMMDRYDYDVKQCLTWTADGVYAGTVFLREGKFSLTYHSGILQPKPMLDEPYDKYDASDIYLPYIYIIY